MSFMGLCFYCSEWRPSWLSLPLPALCLPRLQGENPVYVWVPLTKPKRRREKGLVEEEVSDLQVGACLGA